MTYNLEGVHRLVRIVVGVALVAVAILNSSLGAQNIVVGAIGVVLLATAFLSYCPLYTLLGFPISRPTDKAT